MIPNEGKSRPQSYVADDGCLHVVADRGSIRDALARLDLPRARLLTRLSLFWVRRVRCGAGFGFACDKCLPNNKRQTYSG